MINIVINQSQIAQSFTIVIAISLFTKSLITQTLIIVITQNTNRSIIHPYNQISKSLVSQILITQTFLIVITQSQIVIFNVTTQYLFTQNFLVEILIGQPLISVRTQSLFSQIWNHYNHPISNQSITHRGNLFTQSLFIQI